MPLTHDYDTAQIAPAELNNTHVIVGASGGLSAVHENLGPIDGTPGYVQVLTEHGTLVLHPELTVDVLAEAPIARQDAAGAPEWTVVKADDWGAVYRNGKLAGQDHHPEEILADLILGDLPSWAQTYIDRHGEFPENLADVVLDDDFEDEEAREHYLETGERLTSAEADAREDA